MAKNGRPSKLTAEVRKQFLSAITSGCHIDTACEVAGIDYKTMREWVRRGEGTHPTRPLTKEYADFAEEATRALAQAEVTLVSRVNFASVNDWRAATWMLERRYPERWANTQRVQMQVDKELQQFVDTLESKLPPDTYRKVLEAVAETEQARDIVLD